MNQIIIEITWLTAVNKINNDESSKMQILLKIIAETVLNYHDLHLIEILRLYLDKLNW